MLPDAPYIDVGPRGCGDSRKAGGCYLELGLGPGGRPVEDFLVCPPKLLNFDVPAQGQMPIWRQVGEGQYVLHLLDWVGQEFYTNTSDFVEEVRRMGLSRLLAPHLLDASVDHPGTGQPVKVLEALTFDSRLYTAHAHAYIHNLTDYPVTWTCPKHRQHAPGEMCAGAWWWDVIKGQSLDEMRKASDSRVGQFELWAEDDPAPERLVRREMPSFWYKAHRAPDGVTPEYSPAIFAAWPIWRFAVVQGRYGEHDAAVSKLSALTLNLHWTVVDDTAHEDNEEDEITDA